MIDLDQDGDLDWVGTSMTLGQPFVVEQIKPASSMVATISLPDQFDQEITKLVVILTEEVPLKGIPTKIIANIENKDNDEDGIPDVDQMINKAGQITLAVENVGETGDYHVVAVIYVEGGGRFQPKTGVDFMGNSELVTLGNGTVEVEIELETAP